MSGSTGDYVRRLRKQQERRHPHRGHTTTCDSCGTRYSKAVMVRCEEDDVPFWYCEECYQP